jgi:O-antigen ligase
MRLLTYWLSLTMIFAIPMETVIWIEGIGTVSKAIGIVLMAAWVLTVLIDSRIRTPSEFHLLFGAFVVWNALSILWSYDPGRSMDSTKTWVQVFALTLIFWDLHRTPQARNASMQAYVFGATAVLAFVLQTFLGPGAGAYERAVVLGSFDPNTLGLLLVLGIPLAWYLGVVERQLRAVNLGYVALALVAVLLTGSRGAFLAGLPALALCVSSMGRVRGRAMLPLGALALAVVAFAVAVVPEEATERLATIPESIITGDLGGRGAIWRRGVEVFAEHPVVGVGTAAFRAATRASATAHNTFLSVLAELGLVGLSLFLGIVAMSVWLALRQPPALARTCLALLACWSLGAFSLTWDQKKTTWLVFSFVVVSAGTVSLRDGSGQRRWFGGLEPDVPARGA